MMTGAPAGAPLAGESKKKKLQPPPAQAEAAAERSRAAPLSIIVDDSVGCHSPPFEGSAKPMRKQAGLPQLGLRERPAFASRRLQNVARPLVRNVAANVDGRSIDTIATTI